MAKKYVAFPLKGSDQIVVAEVVELAGPVGSEPAAFPDGVVKKAGETFEAALERVKPIIEGVRSSLANAAEGASEMEVEFSVKLNGEAGIVLTTLGVEANFKIAIKWKS